ncbi:bifunctional nicotinamidase/pyrazinamidase [Jannaschia sp. S6380]|uniref:bifunctional nicotinamidase/pyrazinamidase n=1 Tax=Jannaschia sp. S6380 TaxID=2926408 RepID=UPI001FF29A39|nr:bifunctional nicotinamidase/pyrazinamidase [Jannaschia sp. S6380]MCK0169179.1 bifunctional nicotinamidase/pyrazinamidase [Jannaschia sp. S6380]
MTAALIVIDVQNGFCPGGNLAVPGGDAVVPGINALMGDFAHVVLTQDWHPADHSSFASNHPGRAPYDAVEMPYGPQVLWPDHCIQGTDDAAFHAELDSDRARAVIRKGMNPAIDSYSAFFENDRATPTGLDGLLRALGATELTMVGLALDFCVNFSALDAARLGYAVTVRRDLTRAIDLDGSRAAAEDGMRAAGITLTE